MDANKIPSRRELELLSLVVSPRSGREVAKEYEKSTKKRIPYGTLYSTFATLERAGWVSIKNQTSGDRRVRIFTIRGPGIRALNRACDHYQRLWDRAATALRGVES